MWRASATREDPTPQSAGAGSKIDYTFPDAGIGVEVKHFGGGRRIADLKQELLNDLHDVGRRQDLRFLVVFIVEHSPGVAAPIDDLEGKQDGAVEMRIVRVAV